MECPKCGHQQEGGDVCESCGIYFEKYKAAQLRKEQVRNEQKYTEQLQETGNSKKILPVLAVIGALVGLYLLFDDDIKDIQGENELSASDQTSSANSSDSSVSPWVCMM